MHECNVHGQFYFHTCTLHMVFRITHIKECLSKIPPLVMTQSWNLFHFSILAVLYKMIIFHCLKRFMNLTLFVSINVDWILVSVSCFSGDSLFANAFARGWISELCCPCDLSTFNLQTKNNAHMILTFFMAIFLQYSSTLTAPMLFDLVKHGLSFLHLLLVQCILCWTIN